MISTIYTYLLLHSVPSKYMQTKNHPFFITKSIHFYHSTNKNICQQTHLLLQNKKNSDIIYPYCIPKGNINKEEFNMKNTKSMSTQTMVTGAVLTALVIILQLMGSFIRFGPFAISLVLIPIVIGTATCGKWVGAWLGFVFGLAVLLSGDAALFMVVNVPGTIITVLAKGTLCGLISGLAYEGAMKLFKNSTYFSTLVAAIICPIVNTGIFLIGCILFFMPTVTMWAGGTNVGMYMIVGLVGFNFLFELLVNILFSPIIVRVLNAVKK